MNAFATEYLPSKKWECRITVKGREIVTSFAMFGNRLYLDRLYQVVKRPRACGEVKRKLWPSAKPNAIARAALAHFWAAPNGYIAGENAVSSQLTAGDLRSM